MVIIVKGYASFGRFTVQLEPGGKVTVPDSTTVTDMMGRLKIPEDIRVITMINGRHCTPDHPLRQGDKLLFFPPLEGG